MNARSAGAARKRGRRPIQTLARAVSRALASLAALAVLAASAGHAGGKLRVAVTGDYPPLCERTEGGEYAGLDPAIARQFAAERGYTIEWVAVTWPELAEALREGRFDVAMTGVTVRADRSIEGRFSAPVAESGAVVLVRDPALASPEALARPGVAIHVNAGGHLEQVARARFPQASITALPDNAAVRDAFAAGTAAAVVTDTLEAPRWRALVPSALEVGPLTRDTKAYWLPADRAALGAELDAWLLEREADGTLARLRMQWLGPEAAAQRSALPAAALVAALAERLALMPAVAEAKRASGAPVLAPEREAELLASAMEVARAAARRDRLRAPEPPALEAFFAALFEASRAVQSAVLEAPPPEPAPAWRLDAQLRPALGRQTERMAALLSRLPIRLDENALASELAARTAGLPGFGPAERARLARAVAELASAARSD